MCEKDRCEMSLSAGVMNLSDSVGLICPPINNTAIITNHAIRDNMPPML